jgi:hypothetical protein
MKHAKCAVLAYGCLISPPNSQVSDVKRTVNFLKGPLPNINHTHVTIYHVQVDAVQCKGIYLYYQDEESRCHTLSCKRIMTRAISSLSKIFFASPLRPVESSLFITKEQCRHHDSYTVYSYTHTSEEI